MPSSKWVSLIILELVFEEKYSAKQAHKQNGNFIGCKESSKIVKYLQ